VAGGPGPAGAAQYGAESMESAQFWLYMGLVAFRLERYDEAFAANARALAIAEERQGKEGPDVGAAKNNLANLYERIGRYGDALQAYREALAIFVRHHRPDHPHVGTVHNNLAVIYQRLPP
jgi:tetratricopeptide (TPR) repeat protein